jgi:ubiquinone/menaquinone biosynthesis C-methylase UbiE
MNIIKVYDQIAKEFDKTRFNPWPGVVQFLHGLPKQSLIADIGCGNGKYIKALKETHTFIGLDGSISLLECHPDDHQRLLGFIGGDHRLPFRNEIYDAIICIAVLHHIKDYTDIVKALKEFARVLRPDGQLLVTMWALETDSDIEQLKRERKWTRLSHCEYMVPFGCTKNSRYYHLFDKETTLMLAKDSETFDLCMCDMRYEKCNWQLTFKKKYINKCKT